jgi:diguanylate cyclase (GGDEF)-like protein
MYELIEKLSGWLKQTLNRFPKSVLQLICLGSIAGIGILDYWVQRDILLFGLYLVPVGISAWSLGRRFSDVVVLLCAVVWAFTSVGGVSNLAAGTILWNTIFFAIMLWTLSVLLSNLKVATDVEQQLLRVDPMTGAINRTFFMELLQAEYDRSSRYGYPLTLASLEISKQDQATANFTHEEVESLLADIADQLGFQLRSNDVVARLGDYEFGILLPHTDTAQADVVLDRLKQDLVEHPVLNQSTLRCRVGGMTFLSMPEKTEDLINQTKSILRSLQGDRILQFAHEVFP